MHINHMKQIISILTILLSLSSLFLPAQNTPQELGALAFQVFKTKNYAALDTLTPTVAQIIEIFNQKYPGHPFASDSAFPRKYRHHDQRFKDKCRRLMEDTTEINIDWKNASLQKVDYYERNRAPASDSAAKLFMVNYLDVHFTSRQDTMILQFRSIHEYKDRWKLGESMRITTPARMRKR